MSSNGRRDIQGVPDIRGQFFLIDFSSLLTCFSNLLHTFFRPHVLVCFYVTYVTISFKMPKLLAPELEGGVLALHSLDFSCRDIVAHYKTLGISIGKTAVNNIVRGRGQRRVAKTNGQPFKQRRRRTVRTREFISKVARECKKEDPPTQDDIAKKLKCTKSSVFRVIHQDLAKQKRKKTKVHAMKPVHMQKRWKRFANLLQTDLTKENLEYCCTLDESWLYLQDCNRKRDICYVDKGEKVPDDFVFERHERFGEKVMAVGILTGRGAVPLFFVPGEVKVNRHFYIKKVLRPLVEKYLPALYPGELDRVWVHHDGASSHTAGDTMKYMDKVTETTGIRFIKNHEIPAKSPDGSPLDFFGFGYLKGKLRARHAKTLAGLKRAARQEWAKISVEMITRVFQSWIKRARAIVKARGRHIENVKQLHRKKVLE